MLIRKASIFLYATFHTQTVMQKLIKYSKLIFTSFLILFLSGCLQNKSKEKMDESYAGQKIEPAQSDFTVIEFNPEWYWIYKNVSSSTLSENEVQRVEEILKTIVKENNDSLNEKTESRFSLKLKGYKKQFVPVLNEKGEKEVWANMFCSDFETESWKNGIVEVEDGGNCFWNVKINLTTGKYYALSINGYA